MSGPEPALDPPMTAPASPTPWLDALGAHATAYRDGAGPASADAPLIAISPARLAALIAVVRVAEAVTTPDVTRSNAVFVLRAALHALHSTP